MKKIIKQISLVFILLIIIIQRGNSISDKDESNNRNNDLVSSNQDLTNFKMRRMVDFNNHPVGAYLDNQYKSDWKVSNSLYQPNTTKIQNVDDRRVLANFYPKGTWGRGGGLNQFGRLDNSDDIQEIYLSYRLKFQNDFDFALGGKLPGVIFGTVSTVASGGAGPDIGDKGASMRLMWVKGGRITMYIYHHSMKTKYGDNMGLGVFSQFERGKWHTLTFRVVANEIGKANGIMQVWLDEKLIASASNIEMRTSTSPKTIKEIALNTFMGGADERFGPIIDQYLWMDDFYFWQYSDEFLKNNTSVARGLKLHSEQHQLFTPLSNFQKSEVNNLSIQSSPIEGGKIIIKNN